MLNAARSFPHSSVPFRAFLLRSTPSPAGRIRILVTRLLRLAVMEKNEYRDNTEHQYPQNGDASENM
jgi:hypothetical protein